MKEEVAIGNIGDASESMDLQIPDSFCKPQMLKTRGIYNTQQLQIIPINEVLSCNGQSEANYALPSAMQSKSNSLNIRIEKFFIKFGYWAIYYSLKLIIYVCILKLCMHKHIHIHIFFKHI